MPVINLFESSETCLLAIWVSPVSSSSRLALDLLSTYQTWVDLTHYSFLYFPFATQRRDYELNLLSIATITDTSRSYDAEVRIQLNATAKPIEDTIELIRQGNHHITSRCRTDKEQIITKWRTRGAADNDKAIQWSSKDMRTVKKIKKREKTTKESCPPTFLRYFSFKNIK